MQHTQIKLGKAGHSEEVILAFEKNKRLTVDVLQMLEAQATIRAAGSKSRRGSDSIAVRSARYAHIRDLRSPCFFALVHALRPENDRRNDCSSIRMCPFFLCVLVSLRAFFARERPAHNIYLPNFKSARKCDISIIICDLLFTHVCDNMRSL